ncbi:hypothetical protein M5X17_31105 [Paenibacillus alvei]|uniref:hypothetical protein n=1 Tax=Paenibacillus alvei TaxID=44250 RepID=UPI00227F4DFA|nr:hypothetical protein [Paenibacillus alvei]MCY9738142.1 hypothetical protein [Paenibacillus alvei]
MAGRSIYLTEKEIEMLTRLFDYGNISFEGDENEEEQDKIAESIRQKVNKN